MEIKIGYKFTSIPVMIEESIRNSIIILVHNKEQGEIY